MDTFKIQRLSDNKKVHLYLSFFFYSKKLKMVKAKRDRQCPPGIPKRFINKWKGILHYKKGDGQEAWREVFTSAAHEWGEMSKTKRKGKYDKGCFTSSGKLKKKYSPKYEKRDGVSKKKRKSKKGTRRSMPKTHVGITWVRKNCGDLAADAMKEKGLKSVGKKWIEENCPGSDYDKYIKSKKKKTLGGCGCARCRMGLGGCACMSGDNCRNYTR
jgi:hypothetical protein